MNSRTDFEDTHSLMTMMRSYTVALFAVILCFGSGCRNATEKTDAAPTPFVNYHLSADDFAKTSEAANRGDIVSMHRLANYYLLYKSGDEQGWLWLEKAAALGDTEARQSVINYYSS